MRTKRRTNWPRCLCGVAIFWKDRRLGSPPFEAFSRREHRCDYTDAERRDRDEFAARTLDGAA